MVCFVAVCVQLDLVVEKLLEVMEVVTDLDDP